MKSKQHQKSDTSNARHFHVDDLSDSLMQFVVKGECFIFECKSCLTNLLSP